MSVGSFGVASLRRPAHFPFVEQAAHPDVFATWAARSVTLVRVPIAIAGLVALVGGRGVLAVAAFSLFAAIDVFDGVAARKVGVDTAARRAGDVLLDRAAIHAAALTCCMLFSSGWAVWLLLLSRDVMQAVVSLRFTLRNRMVVVGAHWHMCYGLVMLLWGSVFILQEQPNLVLTVLAGLVSMATFWDYRRRCNELEKRFLF